jgi:type IV secretory pathway VirB2 component (pilin)
MQKGLIISPYFATRIIAGLMLILAVVAKVESRVSTPFAKNPFSEILGYSEYSEALLFSALIIEAIVGLSLIFGKVHWLGVGLYIVLAFASLAMWYNGETSCGCFGRISVSPLTTLTTNLMFAIGLSVFYLQSKRVE